MLSRFSLCALLIMLSIVTMATVYGQSTDVLPAPLYFIRHNDQIWRMETDATTLTQITHEEAPVTNFDVSPVDGALVYVSDNDLIRTDAFAEDRTVLVDGLDMPSPENADTGEGYLQKLNGEIRSPRWSPDAEQIAFAMGGIHVVSSQGGETQLLLPNSLSEVEGDPMIAFLGSISYLPEAWSPDGSRLVVQVLMPPEQGGLAILTLADNALISITNEEYDALTCCFPSWSADSSYVYYAIPNQFFTPGLWRADAQTGESVTLIQGITDDGTYNLVSYPRELSDGKLYHFLTVTDQPDTNDIMPLTMHRSAPDGVTDREALRSDSYKMGQALWAGDGSGAVIEVYVPSVDIPPLYWLAADDSPAVSLDISGTNLHWGQP
jgi:Tol biopolymer transport system component